MTAPAPVQLPLTREQALAQHAKTRYPGDGFYPGSEQLQRDWSAFEAVLAEAGLPLAYAEPAPAPPPEPRWPAKLEVERGDCAHLLRAVDDEDWYFALSTPDRLDQAAVAEEVARRWSRVPELEEEIVSRARQVEGLLGTLADRTDEHDDARSNWNFWKGRFNEAVVERDEALADADARRIEAENYERLYVDSLEARKKLTSERDAARVAQFMALAELDAARWERNSARKALDERTRERDSWNSYANKETTACALAVAGRDAARQEAAELRRQAEAALKEISSVAHDGHYREAEDGSLDCGSCRAREILRGQRPVPGSEGGSGA